MGAIYALGPFHKYVVDSGFAATHPEGATTQLGLPSGRRNNESPQWPPPLPTPFMNLDRRSPS